MSSTTDVMIISLWLNFQSLVNENMVNHVKMVDITVGKALRDAVITCHNVMEF